MRYRLRGRIRPFQARYTHQRGAMRRRWACGVAAFAEGLIDTQERTAPALLADRSIAFWAVPRVGALPPSRETTAAALVFWAGADGDGGAEQPRQARERCCFSRRHELQRLCSDVRLYRRTSTASCACRLRLAQGSSLMPQRTPTCFELGGRAWQRSTGSGAGAGARVSKVDLGLSPRLSAAERAAVPACSARSRRSTSGPWPCRSLSSMRRAVGRR